MSRSRAPHGFRFGSKVAATLGVAALALGTAAAVPGTAAAAGPDDRGLTTSRPTGVTKQITADGRLGAVPDHGRFSFLLDLDVSSTSQVFERQLRTQSRQVAKQAARQQKPRVTSAQSQVIADLPAATKVLYRTETAMSAVAVTTDADNYTALTGIDGVAAVYPIAPKSYDNSYAVPLQGAPAAWQGSGVLGKNTTVAVIDTGIDFTHANFGGPGTTAAYDSEHAHADDATLWSGSGFPTAKVIGGYDLVGDDYDADPTSDTYNPTPAPDPNPLDCEGHGSHVAGSVAGYGENADGTTYDGEYDESTDFESMRIGPGMAPRASLYAFRVFGCNGSTDVVGEAIDRALDPNGDGDPSDAVDVINMSLGSPFGSPEDGDAVMADAASDAGVTMAISAGNDYDLYDVGGSPGSARKAITVAASVDAQSVADGLDVQFDGADAPDAPFAAERSVAYDWASGDDLSGEVVAPTSNTTGCTAFTGADAAAISGKIALLTWTDDNLECGSVARSGNVAAAGGIGFVFASSSESFSAGITGSAVIPGVLVAHSGGQSMRDALAAGKTVTVTGTEPNAVRQEFPADDDKVVDFSSRGIRGAGNVKPDVAAVGTTVFSTAVGTGSEGVSESGTSMAAPMVAGLAALVVSAHPDWTPEQVKADIMNTAGENLYTGDDHSGDRYAPNRVGAGRIQADKALVNDVLAYVTDDPGAVSVSFGPLAVTEPTTLTKTVKVQNTGLTTRTYATSYDEVTGVPGVDYSVSPASVTVGPRSSQTVTVTLTIADPTALTKTVDPTHGREDASGLPLQTLADASGNLVLTPSAGDAPALRVPVYSAPRPASSMSQADSLSLPRDEAPSASLELTGTGVDQGDGAESVFSLVSGFELQATSPVLPECADASSSMCASTNNDKAADLKYVGVTSDAPYADPDDAMAYFAVASQGPHGTAAGQTEYDLYLDTDRDGAPDLVAYNSRIPDEDVMITNLVDLATGDVVDSEFTNVLPGSVDTASYDSDVIVMPVWLTALADYGVDADNPRLDYAVATFSSSRYGEVDEIGWTGSGDVSGALTTDVFTPGVTVLDDADPFVVALDQPGTDLTVSQDPTSYAADGGQGVLMVHFHNEVGSKAQVVKLSTTKLQGTVTLKAPNKAKVKTKVTTTATVKQRSGVVPTGTVVLKTSAGKKLASGKLKNGKATLTFKPTKTGTLKLKAIYQGDANYTDGTSSMVKVKITKK